MGDGLTDVRIRVIVDAALEAVETLAKLAEDQQLEHWTHLDQAVKALDSASEDVLTFARRAGRDTVKLVSRSALQRARGVGSAAVTNWLKRNKVRPLCWIDGEPYFDPKRLVTYLHTTPQVADKSARRTAQDAGFSRRSGKRAASR